MVPALCGLTCQHVYLSVCVLVTLAAVLEQTW